ncbi:GABA-specific permease [Cyberlindnera fabianii]|uniref:GABA-specific permease n=1 Tax=Cyberlindnera fabianii TaxID=36022 RepID=A0A1V2KZD7_CYBFA|nr:GABA-specific permease [Cyberlindnera fabianii]
MNSHAGASSMSTSYGSTAYTTDEDHVDPDEEFLAALGYKQELKRTYGTLQIFGLSFSIMGLVPSIACTLSFGLMAGPAAIIWGWLITGAFILLVGTGMSELASSLPTSGGLYFWSYHFSPAWLKVPLSFFIGITNSLALCGALCSITYGLAGQVLACVHILYGTEVTDMATYICYATCIFFQTILCLFPWDMQRTSIAINCLLIMIVVAALPISTKIYGGEFNSMTYVFAGFENRSTWPDWWAFIQFGSMSAVWTVGSFDSCVHMSEEAKHPSRSVPIGIISSISVCWILGVLVNIVIVVCMVPDVDRLLNSETGEPLAQILLDSFGETWALLVMILISTGQFLMGANVLIAVSRQMWAFARDGGLPLAEFVKVVSWGIPLRAVCASSIIALIMGAFSLAGSTVANALFSISILGTYVSWVTPQLMRFIGGTVSFVPGVFYLGPKLSSIINIVSIVFQIIIIVVSCLPEDIQNVSKETMNYTIVLNGLIWGISMIFFFVHKKKSYFGPHMNLDYEEIEASEIFDAVEVEIETAPTPTPAVKMVRESDDALIIY